MKFKRLSKLLSLSQYTGRILILNFIILEVDAKA